MIKKAMIFKDSYNTQLWSSCDFTTVIIEYLVNIDHKNGNLNYNNNFIYKRGNVVNIMINKVIEEMNKKDKKLFLLN